MITVVPIVDDRIASLLRAVTQSVRGTGFFLVCPAPKCTVLFRESDDEIAWSTYLDSDPDAGAFETVRPLKTSRERTATRFVVFNVRLAMPCRLVVVGTRSLTLSPAHAYVVRTLLAHLDVHSRPVGEVPFGERLRLLESVVVNANDAVLITEAQPFVDSGPRILYANPAFTKITGYKPADVLGKTPRLLQGPDTDRTACARIRTALANFEPVEEELLNYKKDGTPFWIELSIVPVADATGTFTHWVSVQRDTTARHIARQAAIRAKRVEAQRAALEAEIAARKDVEAQLAHAAYTDTLTGLANRALFIIRLEAALADVSTDPDDASCVLFLDLDRFKFVNDSLGHTFGDLLLNAVAGRLRRCLRECDSLARMGGDEFAVIVKGTPAMGEAVAHRIVRAFALPFILDGNNVPCSVSIGIACAARTSTVTDILRDADTAMYHAKQVLGGANCMLFDATMHANVVSRVKRELDLRSAIVANELFVEYQPIVDIRRGCVEGVEALVRWNHSDDGTVGPDRFIPLAEATGDIVAICAFVMERAFADFAEQVPTREPLYVSINVSSREFDHGGDFIAKLRATLERTRIDPANVHIEITEGIVLNGLKHTHEVIEKIRSLGCLVAFDDFGMGYSNLGYLPRFPIDTLKIDKAFVAGVEQPGVQRKVLRTITLLAESLDLALIVEGVETREQADSLREIGCLKHQGFLYSRPVRRDSLDAIVAEIETRCAVGPHGR